MSPDITLERHLNIRDMRSNSSVKGAVRRSPAGADQQSSLFDSGLSPKVDPVISIESGPRLGFFYGFVEGKRKIEMFLFEWTCGVVTGKSRVESIR